MKILMFCCSFFTVAYGGVHTSYLWHLQQPIYWPEARQDSTRYMRASEGLQGSPRYPGHPQNNLGEIFGKDDRSAIYQYRLKDSIGQFYGYSEAGAQVSYSGCLMENVESLSRARILNYGDAYPWAIREALNWQNHVGQSRLDMTGFTFHHALAPLISPKVFARQIAMQKIKQQESWGSSSSRGFRMAEESFSIRNIKPIVEAGYEWVIVPNHHLARAQTNYKRLHQSAIYDPPNRADQINPESKHYWHGQIDGRAATLSVPFSYQAHWIQYVDPETAEIYRIVAVPMADILSYHDGYSHMGTGLIEQNIAPYTEGKEVMILFSHDGDNAFGGGYSYYHESVPQFVRLSSNKGYNPTTIETFLSKHKPQEDDIVHVEDGSWVNAANDWGHPQFINWLWPPQRSHQDPQYNHDDPSTYTDIANGWSEDFRNWAVIVAGENWVETAEQYALTKGEAVDLRWVVDPSKSERDANDAEKAWHYFMPALTSGYMYYGAALDMEVKPSLAINQSLEYAKRVVHQDANIKDRTPPSVFIPQRFPYNPGSLNEGALYRYKSWMAKSEVTFWTFAYDVSGLNSVKLMYRIDKDGRNPLQSIQNEIYAKGDEVGEWLSLDMTKRAGSEFVDNIFNDPNIDFFIMPKVIADQYWIKVSGLAGKLIDYYIEAEDHNGNVRKTDIQHVYIGTFQG